MKFSSIHTAYGLARVAQAEATGIPINLTHIAVGDGNGNPTTPSEDQTVLVRERYRAAVNRVYQSPDVPGRFTAELVIPASVGGFTLREVGVFDDQGGLFVVGNLPDTYKPTTTEGVFADTVVRVEFAVSNSNFITLQVDPNVAVATQSWITHTITLPYLLKGGTTGQVLSKNSNADGDVEWIAPTTAQVVVTTLEETQTLAADQTAITLSVVTTIGLAIYVDGSRLRSDQWTPHPIDVTKLTLGQAYPAGTKVILVQNEPAAFVPTPLIASKNLQDVPTPSAARGNLGVDSKTSTDTHAPAGLVAHFARSTAPTGWLKANGAAISRTAYASLFAAIGTTFGGGDGFNTFNLPDLRGEFLRGWDDGRGLDAGRGLGSVQGSQNLAHQHTGSTSTVGHHQHDSAWGERIAGPYGDARFPARGSALTDNDNYSYLTSPAGSHNHSFTTDASGGTEARPRNVAMLACIKY